MHNSASSIRYQYKSKIFQLYILQVNPNAIIY